MLETDAYPVCQLEGIHVELRQREVEKLFCSVSLLDPLGGSRKFSVFKKFSVFCPVAAVAFRWAAAGSRFWATSSGTAVPGARGGLRLQGGREEKDENRKRENTVTVTFFHFGNYMGLLKSGNLRDTMCTGVCFI